MNEIDTMLVDGNKEDFWVIWFRRLFHFEERWAECWPFVNDLEEFDLGIVRCHTSVAIKVANYILKMKNIQKIENVCKNTCLINCLFIL